MEETMSIFDFLPTEEAEKYKPYEAKNGWGTVNGVINFFETIIKEWERFRDWEGDELANVTTFWIT